MIWETLTNRFAVSNYLQVNQSLRKLVNLGVTLFYPSHGEVITQEKVVETIKWTGFIVHKYANLK